MFQNIAFKCLFFTLLLWTISTLLFIYKTINITLFIAFIISIPMFTIVGTIIVLAHIKNRSKIIRQHSNNICPPVMNRDSDEEV